MGNPSEKRGGSLGGMVVVGAVCFVMGYLAAVFMPAVSGSKFARQKSGTVSAGPHADENLGREVDPETVTPVDPVKEPAKKPEQATPGEPAKTPTP